MLFDIPLQFLSKFDAYEEVYLPVVGLLSFLYPRLNDAKAKENTANLLSTYFVPGPSLFFKPREPSSNEGSFALSGSGGDHVEISVGSFVHFTGCYLKSVRLTVENSFNVAGYPHNVKADVSFEAMDSSFVDFDGSFMKTGLGNQSIVLNEELELAADQAEKALESGSEHLNTRFGKIETALKDAFGIKTGA
jgi:hypothetical protein